MKKYVPPLSVHFIWHSSDSMVVEPLVEYCVQRLQRQADNPFSRSLNIPLFLEAFGPDPSGGKHEHNSAAKTMTFVFLSKGLADTTWTNHVERLSKMNGRMVPVALDRSAIKTKTTFSTLNFLRLYDFDAVHKETQFFIAAAHEIYRFTLNQKYDQKAKGKENAIRLFLSHTKADRWAVALAEKLKDFVDKSSMRNFFDTADIAPAYRFDREIKAYLGESTLISVHSDSYFSRYWCQQEILHAKQKLRPMVAVDHLRDSEDRTFPHAGNVPVVHITPEGDVQEEHLYRILEAALLETLRFFYQEQLLRTIQKSLGVGDVIVLARPPEPSDLSRLLKVRNDVIEKRVHSILYPEPPLYQDELRFLDVIGIHAVTPLTAGEFSFPDCRAGISISDVEIDEIRRSGLPRNQMKLFAQDVARHLIARGAKLVYGGDLRNDGFTEFLFSEAAALRDRLPKKSKRISNYVAWPIYLRDTEDVKRWKADYSYVAEMKEMPPPKDAMGLIHDRTLFIEPDTTANKYIWGTCLTSMRHKMIRACDVRVSAGGRLTGYKGKYPGVLEEITIALNMGKPVYLVGAYGGVTQRVCDLLTNGKMPEELTLDWQKANNAGYEELVREFERHGKAGYVAYEEIVASIHRMGLTGLCKLNNLTEEENLRLFQTPFTEEAILLIIAGIGRTGQKRRRKR